MPAPEGPIVGIDFLISANGNTIGGRQGATLNLGVDTEDVTNADENSWMQTIANLRNWSIDFDGLALLGATPAVVSGQGAALKVWDDVAMEYVELEHLQTYSIGIEAEAIQIASQTTGRDPLNLYGVRSVSISADAIYVDPESNNGAALGLLLDARDNGETIDCQVEFGAEPVTFQADFTLSDLTLEAPYDEGSPVSITLDNDGTVTQTGTDLGAGLDELLSALFADPPTDIDAIFTTEVTDATEWTGTTIASSLSIEVPFDGAINISGTLTGDGALTQQATSA